MKLIPDDLRSEINLRVKSLRAHMKNAGINAIIVASNPNIYYTTCRFFRGYVYIPLTEKPLWFVIKPNIFDAEDDVISIRKPEMITSELERLGYTAPQVVAYEFDDLSYSDISRLMRTFPNAKAENGSAILRKSRMVKTRWELDKMHEDGIHQAEVYRRITKCYKENMTDIEFQIEIERVLRLEGCLGFVRTSGNLMDINLGSVIAGDNADTPSPYDFTMGGAGIDPSLPGGANGTMLKPGQTVMVDMNGSFNGYQTDMTRVWRIGELPRIAYKAHECSRNILRSLEEIAKPDVKASTLYRKAIEIVEGENLSQYFMGHRQQAAFIGHGVGIELNEQPVIMERSKDLLLENMTIALEPKFVIPDVGAVGVENTYRVTSEGLESITIFPEEIQEL